MNIDCFTCIHRARQFQLLLCFVAVAVQQGSAAASSPANKTTNSPTPVSVSKARQPLNNAFSFNRAASSRNLPKEEASVPMHTSLAELLKNVGIDVPDSTAALAQSVHHDKGAGSTVRFEDSHTSVILPSSDKPEDMYTRTSNHTRESTYLRMENLFDEVTLKIRNMRYGDLSEAEKQELPGDLEEYSTASLRNTGKPTVIGDSIPPPMMIPAAVQHVSADLFSFFPHLFWSGLVCCVVLRCIVLCCISVLLPRRDGPAFFKLFIATLQSLEAALAYHNLGSYEESLIYLETARAQLMQTEKEKLVTKKKQEWRKSRGPTEKAVTAVGEDKDGALQQKIEVTDEEITLPSEAKLYIIACKGNVYQSCGDDEQSMLQYMLGWNEATSLGEKDWEAIFINSIGLLSFYNLRYELAWKCFSLVTSFRGREYGPRSADTATSWNNTACCLLCMSRTSEARVLFEQARAVFVDSLGDRHPRTLVSNKNCVKARRSQTIVHTQNIKGNIALRPDADRLILGKDISINAAPLETKSKSSAKLKGKKKK